MPVTLSSLGAKTMRRLTLTSGTSWTVPAGVTFVNVTLVGGGGGGGASSQNYISGAWGAPGATISSTLAVTAGASISYAIGAGGGGVSGPAKGGTGGTTSFTGATSASGGLGGSALGTDSSLAASTVGSLSYANNGGGPSSRDTSWGVNVTSGAGGSGFIIVEYWV
jgi:hypothetical protein